MKKIYLALASVLLFSCGTSAAKPNESKPAEAVQKTEEPAAAADEAPVDSAADRLLGEWEEIPGSKTESNETTGIKISFDAEGLRVNDGIRKSSSFSKVEYGDIYGIGNGQISKITVTPQEVSGSDINEADILANPVDFELLTCEVNGTKYLALRELGNGTSYFGMGQFRQEYQDEQYFWTFRKLGDEPGVIQNTNLRKNEEFYAFCWYRTEDSLYLQEVDADIRQEDWYGLDRPMMYLIMDQMPEAATQYPVPEELQWRIFPQGIREWRGSISPYLMRIITDEEGNIKKFYEMQYYGAGMYEASEGSMWDYAALLPEGPETVYITTPGGILTHDDDLVYADVSSGDSKATVMLFTKSQVKNLRVLEVAMEGVDDAGEPVFTGKEVYRMDRFYPEHPFVLTLTFFGDIPNNAISYEEPYGEVKYYAIGQSGMDGSLLLSELKNVKE